MLRALCAASLAVAIGWIQAPREQPSCQYNIVSSTVVTAYCSHVIGENEVLDLLIAWRGQPGWFQRRSGGGGTRQLGTGPKGRVSQYEIYSDVTIAFDADFDAGTVAIGDVTVPLKGVNAILIDQVARADTPRRPTALWIEPRLPLGVDVNLFLARRSRDLRQFLRCDVPMPAASPRLMPHQPLIITLCEKLASKPPRADR